MTPESQARSRRSDRAQLRRVAGIDLVGAIDAVDDPLSVRIAHRLQPRDSCFVRRSRSSPGSTMPSRSRPLRFRYRPLIPNP